MDSSSIFFDEYVKSNKLDRDNVIEYYQQALDICKFFTIFELYTFISVWLNNESDFPDFIELFNKNICGCRQRNTDVCPFDIYYDVVGVELVESAIKDYILSQECFPELIDKIKERFIITNHRVLYKD